MVSFKPGTHLLSNAVQPHLERPIMADLTADTPQGKLSFICNALIHNLKRVCTFEQPKKEATGCLQNYI